MSETTRIRNLDALTRYRQRREAQAAARHRWLHDWIPATVTPEPRDWSALACYAVSGFAALYGAAQLVRWWL